jgi:hypothetical protein
MDLTSIKTKLQPVHFEHYNSVNDFIADCKLIFSNCALFNDVSSAFFMLFHRVKSSSKTQRNFHLYFRLNQRSGRWAKDWQQIFKILFKNIANMQKVLNLQLRKRERTPFKPSFHVVVFIIVIAQAFEAHFEIIFSVKNIQLAFA